MKAAYYDRQGPASEVLKLGEFALPEPGPNEVRVKLHASGVNPSDIKARAGFSAKMGFPAIIPHQDGAGTIDKVGAGVSHIRSVIASGFMRPNTGSHMVPPPSTLSFLQYQPLRFMRVCHLKWVRV